MQNDRSRSDILLDAIGGIEDRFIFEAMDPAPIRRTAPLFRRFALVGVSLALALCVGMTSLIASLMQKSGSSESPEQPSEQATPAPDLNVTTVTLTAALADLRDSTAHRTETADELDLHGGKGMIVWKYADEEFYRTVRLSYGDSYILSQKLKLGKDFTEVGEDFDANGIEGVWICTGDGTVVSPFLKLTNGNVGYGRLFTYEAELEPSGEFTELTIELITEAN